MVKLFCTRMAPFPASSLREMNGEPVAFETGDSPVSVRPDEKVDKVVRSVVANTVVQYETEEAQRGSGPRVQVDPLNLLHATRTAGLGKPHRNMQARPTGQ
jgi:hypothetical protein